MSAIGQIPEGHHSLTPSVIVPGADKLIEFLVAAFGGKVVDRYDGPDGSVAHAEIRIGDSVVMLAEENEAWGNRSPLSLGGSPMFLMAYVDDVDAAFCRAIEAGATEVRPVADQFYGDRSGTLKDPYGHQWTLSTHVEDVSEAEAQRRMEAEFSKT